MPTLDRSSPYVLGLFRVVVGFFFACHGVASLFGVLGHPDRVEVGAWPSFYAAAIQLVAGVLVAAGVGTRLAATIGSGSMAYAYFSVHQPHGLLPILNDGEPAAMFCWTLLLLAFMGPGRLTATEIVATVRSRFSAAGTGRTPQGTVAASQPSATPAASVPTPASAPAVPAAPAPGIAA